MIEEPCVLATAVGPIAAVLASPADPKAAMLVIQGSGSTRSGVNQIWTRIARNACADGVAALRADYAGMSESWGADPHQRAAAVRATAAWLCDRAGDVPLFLIGNCYGLSPTASVCRDRDVAGVALLLPPILSRRSRELPAVAQTTTLDRLRATADLVRGVPRRLANRARYGPARHVSWVEQAEPGNNPVRDLEELVTLTRTYLLMGGLDNCTQPVGKLMPKLRDIGHVEAEVIDGIALRGAATREAQDAMSTHLGGWLRRSVAALEAAT